MPEWWNKLKASFFGAASDIQTSKNALREITGLNELTDGSTPNPKTLTTIANLANESTNNALYAHVKVKSELFSSIAKGIIERLQSILIGGNKYDGYNPNNGRWITVGESIKHYDYDIKVESKPTDEQKQWLFDLVREDIKTGVLDTSDVITIINTANIKSAQMLLSFKAKRNREAKEAQAIENSRITAENQANSNAKAEQAKLQADMIRHEQEIDTIAHTKAWDYVIQQEKNMQSAENIKLKAQSTVLDPTGQGSENVQQEQIIE